MEVLLNMGVSVLLIKVVPFSYTIVTTSFPQTPEITQETCQWLSVLLLEVSLGPLGRDILLPQIGS